MTILEGLAFVLNLIFTVGCLIVFCATGFVAAIAAAATALVAFPLSLLLSLVFGIAFIDALAWTWSLLTVGALISYAVITVIRRKRGQPSLISSLRFRRRSTRA